MPKKLTQRKIRGWIVLPHHTASHGQSINGQQIYIQKIKPRIILSCKSEGNKFCEATVVPCTITYTLNIKK